MNQARNHQAVRQEAGDDALSPVASTAYDRTFIPDVPAVTAQPKMRIAVGIATLGRPQLLPLLLQELTRQSRPSDAILICAPSQTDVGRQVPGGAELIIAAPGLTRQRNAILDRAAAYDVVVFFDDDFLPEEGYIETIEQIFSAHADVAMVTGELAADGILGPGLSIDEARRYLAATAPAHDGKAVASLDAVEDGYGCNMAVRVSAIKAAGCRFDERLPLYAWLEDVDFSRRLRQNGRIVKAQAARGVHLGVKQGRISGLRLGYSQIANPVYLMRKGTFPWRRALRLMGRNVAANVIRSMRPEPYIDRRGRVAGNLRALRDLFAGHLAPERILEL